MSTPWQLLVDTGRRDSARPFLTWYDDATGERSELSVATTTNWVAKVAHLLIEEYDVEPDDLVSVRLPLHWQTAVVLLAAWATGAAVAFDQGGKVSVGLVDTGSDIELTLATLGTDLSRLVAAQPDDFVAEQPSGADVVAAAPTDLPAGARVLSVVPLDDPSGLGYGLLGPLMVDGSVVLVGNPDPAAVATRCAAERVTHTLGVDVAGVPRLA